MISNFTKIDVKDIEIDLSYELEKINVVKEDINSIRVDFKYKVGLQEKDRTASMFLLHRQKHYPV